MHKLADAQGFALRHQWWLEHVLHDRARQVATAAYVALWIMVLRPVGFWRAWPLWQRLQVALGVTWGLLAVRWMKRQSATSCPWDLQDFGGVARYVSHWQWGVGDGGPGHCFPGGHASAALAFVAVALPCLASPTARKLGWKLLAGILLAGAVLGIAQTLRGAHYPSHTLWTALVCWCLALANQQCFDGWRSKGARREACLGRAQTPG